ncbi:predicted protein [Phaeodactylum tricornutum CCAP 1055/1]|uniref:RING-type domain-containing protein n=1 Tax=Phaeodactylum tricornutum (strain CCAP 1055/1) TaxID=556484 RepID=B7FXD1_PHATC|nr:predicted protein [Phaeodactylum tricornutum CCAP 1055/1]EEC49139.1 predicted protein [Phaeodactylum tricornutum CCAP 1055/1]|eukprot:XP_002179316.1 predicted protein [Phaeodactylum tricornutum CCAP 1055/1]
MNSHTEASTDLPRPEESLTTTTTNVIAVDADRPVVETLAESATEIHSNDDDERASLNVVPSPRRRIVRRRVPIREPSPGVPPTAHGSHAAGNVFRIRVHSNNNDNNNRHTVSVAWASAQSPSLTTTSSNGVIASGGSHGDAPEGTANENAPASLSSSIRPSRLSTATGIGRAVPVQPTTTTTTTATPPTSTPQQQRQQFHIRIGSEHFNRLRQSHRRQLRVQPPDSLPLAGIAPGYDATLHVTIPSLEPQILPDAKQLCRDIPADGNDSLERFRCDICTEFLQTPTTCGRCTGRFCHACLERALARSSLTVNGSDEDTGSCPTCRDPVPANVLLQTDTALQQAMQQAPLLPCRYQGCTEQLALAQVAVHEASCPHVRCSCRFVDWGCDWTGTRRDLPQHELSCDLAKVDTLIQRHRILQAEYRVRVEGLETQLQAVGHELGIQRQYVRQSRQLSLYNPLDVYRLCVTILCATPQFMATKDWWATLYNPAEKHTAINNLLTLLPTSLVTLRTVWDCFRVQERLLWGITEDHILPPIHPDLDVLDVALVLVLVGLLACLMVMCLYLDQESSQRWKVHNFPNLVPFPVFGALFTVSLIVLYSVVIDFYGGGLYASFLWLRIVVATLLFPAIVSSCLLSAAQTPLFGTGRVYKPLLVGLLFGFTFSFFGFQTTGDALAILQLVLHWKVAERWIAGSGVLTPLPVGLSCLYLSLRVGQWKFHEGTTWMWLLATLSILSNLALVFNLPYLGQAISESLMRGAQASLTAGPSRQPDGSPIGCAVAIAWGMTLLSIAVSF